MLLGIDWLRSYSQVTFNFKLNSVSITRDGQILELKGIEEGAKLKVVSAAQWCQGVGECYLLSHHTSAKEEQKDIEIHPQLRQILDSYEDVFMEARGLPPSRLQDHHIPLQPNAVPVNVRPYRYSHEKKKEIEKRIRELLNQSIIQ